MGRGIWGSDKETSPLAPLAEMDTDAMTRLAAGAERLPVITWSDCDLPDEGTENIGAWLEHRMPSIDC